MACVLFDDWFYIDVDGNCGVYGRQELGRNSKFKKLSVAFMDYQTKIVSFTEDMRSPVKEVFINSAFDESFLITQERLSASSILVIGAKKDKIEEIYRCFNGVRIESVVPYAIAIRAFLKSKDLLDSNQCVLFLDDLRNQTILTFFEGGYFSSPRKISMRDPNYMVSEIKRSWQSFLLERSSRGLSSDISLTLVSNNQEWLSSFIQQGFLSKENAFHVNVAFGALEGLKNAKFAMHFALAQDVLKQKKRQLWRNRLKVLSVSLLFVVLGLGFYITNKTSQQQQLAQYQSLQKQNDSLKVQLRKAYQEKFLSFLSQKKKIDYTKIYYDFLQSIPEGYLIDSICFQKDSNEMWSFQGEIYPEDEFTIQKGFKQKLSFSEVDISSIIVNKTLGQRIVLRINQKDNWYIQEDLQKGLALKEEIKRSQNVLKRLEALQSAPVGFINDQYSHLDKQVHMFSRYHDLKISLDIDGLGKEGVISNAAGQSLWPGISALLIHLNFYDLKGIDELIMVFELLETIEDFNPLRILNIVQKSNRLEVGLQLYGRGV